MDVIHVRGLLLCWGGGALSCIGHHLDRDVSIARGCPAFDFNWIHQYCAQYSSDSGGAVLLVRFVPNVGVSVGTIENHAEQLWLIFGMFALGFMILTLPTGLVLGAVAKNVAVKK
ncbi:hypothetical protein FRC0501_02046 [Corynebacterium diphtheriae]|nr:hypothetical protein FRC0501_02046 [Corynebacterium diphtheriae]